MRYYGTLLSLVLGLGLAGTASAQSSLLSFMGGQQTSQQSSFFPVIGQTQNVVVDTRNPAAPIAQPMYVSSTWTKLTSFFPLGVGSIPAKPVGGAPSIFPTPSQMPGANYLQAFGFYRASQVAPGSR